MQFEASRKMSRKDLQMQEVLQVVNIRSIRVEEKFSMDYPENFIF